MARSAANFVGSESALLGAGRHPAHIANAAPTTTHATKGSHRCNVISPTQLANSFSPLCHRGSRLVKRPAKGMHYTAESRTRFSSSSDFQGVLAPGSDDHR